MNSLTGIKDLDKLIVSYLTCKDIINFCKTCKYANKVICDEDFFRNIIYDKYRNTIKYKDYVKNNTWRSYFVYLVYYIDKLEKEYKINYLEDFKNKDASPQLEYLSEKVFEKYSEYEPIPFDRDIVLQEINNLPLLKYSEEQGSDICYYLMF